MLSVILPTYNEVENLDLIIPKISAVFDSHGIEGEIVVVDDNSPDGTAKRAEELAKDYPVRVKLRTENRGLSASIIDGFAFAKGDIYMVMDADLSHPVDAIPEMIKPIEDGTCEITVGSRYIPGGGCADWSLIRKVVSRGAGMLAIGITKLSDPTSGFMAIKNSALEGIKLDPIGWKIVLETVTRTGAKVQEVPIIFSDRIKGESKLDAGVQISYLLHLWRLYGFRLPNFMQFIRFCLVGLSGVFVDTAVLVIAVEGFFLDPRIGAVPAFITAVVWNFFLNRSWTFKPTKSERVLFPFAAFLVVCTSGLVVRVGTMDILLRFFDIFSHGRWYILASITGILASTAVNFLGSRYLVFKKR